MFAYGVNVNVKRNFFKKSSPGCVQTLPGLDLHKVKGHHCVETWASHYDQHNLSSDTLRDILAHSPSSQQSLAQICELELALSPQPQTSGLLPEVEEYKRFDNYTLNILAPKVSWYYSLFDNNFKI